MYILVRDHIITDILAIINGCKNLKKLIGRRNVKYYNVKCISNLLSKGINLVWLLLVSVLLVKYSGIWCIS